MRLGIRGKLIGTLMLVGLLPLVISLVVILVGGAAIRFRAIRDLYEDTAAMCANRISNTLLREELEKLALIARLPRVNAYVLEHSAPADGAIPLPAAADQALDQRWAALPETAPEVAAILRNEAALRLTLVSDIDAQRRHVQIANTRGQLIAADSKTDDFFQADEDWWRAAYDHGRGRLYISTITTSNGGLGKFSPGERVVEIALPIYATIDGKPALIGILKDELAVSWLLQSLQDIPAAKHLDVLTQLVDLNTMKTIHVAGGPGSADNPLAARGLKFYLDHRDQTRVGSFTLLNNGLIVGSARVGLGSDLKDSPAPLFAAATVPDWVILVSNSSDAAMAPVYGLAALAAGIGIALILVLFILGVGISNREVIIPILRLRAATAAVGRGELNVRVLSDDARDKTFRPDELGQLAHDFDAMTRQLQKNINQLARSNEAKRRFMELAGHELRTPVTYLLGVCQLAQKQLRMLSAAATDGTPEDERTIALAAQNAASIASALNRISAKTQRLTRIIDNLLKLVNNDQFTTRMNKTPVDVRALILQVAADHRPFIAERKQQLEVDVSETLPPLEADRDKLEDTLTNLLSNAIRFSPDGSKVRIAAHQAVGGMLEILVEDSGPGIPAGDLANLFEPFYTGADVLHHSSGTTEYGTRGIGLGLAIVRRFVELHGGIVRAQAIMQGGQTVGTQFQILLPLMKPDLPDAAPASPARN